MIKRYLSSVYTLFFLLISFVSNAQNQSLAGAEISYKSVGNNVYQVQIAVYRDCSSPIQIQNTQSVSYASTICNSSGNITMNLVSSEVLATCSKGVSVCDGGNIRSFQKKTFSGNVTLINPCADYKFRWFGFNRVSAPTVFVNTITSLFVEALLNTVNAPNNSSPSFGSNPMNYLAKSTAITYSSNITEANGDVVSVSSIAPQNSLGVDLTYLSGYSPSQPFSASSTFSLNPSTGSININPQTVEETNIVLRASETRNGNLVGYSTRDMRVEVFQNTIPPPTISGINGSNSVFTINACEGQPISFYLQGGSPSTGTLSLTQETLLSNATFNAPSVTGSITGFFSWTPQTSGIRNVVFRIKDGLCPFEGITTRTITIDVKPKPIITFNLPSNNVIQDCTTPVNISLIPTVTSGTVFGWYNDENLTVVLSSIKDYTVTRAGNYVLTVASAFGCRNQQSIAFLSKLVVDFTYDDPTSCKNKKTKFINNSYVNDITQQTQITGFSWDFGDGSPVLNTNAINRDTSHIYTTNGVKIVKLTGTTNNGCVVTKSFPVNVYEPPLHAIIAGPFKMCEIPGFVSPNATLSGTSFLGINPINRKWVFDNVQIFNEPIPKYSTVNSIVGIKLVYSVLMCADSVSTTAIINKKPKWLTVTPDFEQVCTITSYPNFTLTGVATAVGSALAISNKLTYSWATPGGNFDNPQTLPIVFRKNSSSYSLLVTDTLGCINDTLININAGIEAVFKYDSYYCKPGDLVSISSQSTIRGTPKNWAWGLVLLPSVSGLNSFPTPQTLTGISSTVTGKFDITLYLEDIYGCKDTAIYPMLRYLPNTTVVGVSKNKLCFQELLTLTGARSAGLDDANNINYWKWEYGVGANDFLVNHRNFTDPLSPNMIERVIGGSSYVYADTMFNTVKTYSVSGLYIIKHTIGYNDGSFYFAPTTTTTSINQSLGCQYMYTTTVEMYQELKYKTLSTENKCAGVPTVFKAFRLNTGPASGFSVQPTDFKWEFLKKTGFSSFVSLSTTLGSSLGDTTTVTKTFTQDGTVDFGDNAYRLKLTVKDSKGCIGIHDTIFENIILENPTISSLTTVCQNQIVDFRISTRGDVSSFDNLWYFQDSDFENKRAGTNPNPKFKSSPISIKNYSVTFVGSSGFEKCFTTLSGTYTTNISPSTTFDLPERICSQDPITIIPVLTSNTTDVSVNDLQNVWLFPGGVKEDNLKTSFSKSLPVGLDSITVITKNPLNSCTDTIRKIIDVRFRPKADFTFESKDPSDKPYVYSTSAILFTDITTVSGSNTTLERYWKWGKVNESGEISYDYPVINGITSFDTTMNKSEIFFLKLVLKNTETCKDSISKKVDLTSFLAMPNAFYPNAGEGNINSEFGVFQNGIKRLEVFQIFNRWGQIVFETNDPNIKWNGKHKNSGSELPVGVYMYYVKANTGYNENKEYKGQVTLVR